MIKYRYEDNKLKGVKVFQNEQEREQVNEKIKNLPVIQDLQKADFEIIKDLEGLKDGQEEINERLDKGAERMDGIEADVRDLKDIVIKGFSDIKDTINTKENEKLRSDIEKMIENKNKNENRVWDIIKIFLGVLIVAGLSYVGITKQ